jgi:FAD dependent oxidoreductase
VFFHSTVIDAARDGDQLASATVHDHNGASTVTGSAWVDGSGECDLAAFAGASTRYGTHGFIEAGTLGMRFGGVPADLIPNHDDLTSAVQAAKLEGASLLDKEDSLMARLPLSGDIGIFIVDEAYNALQAKSISDAERHAREKAWAYLAACRTMPGWENAYLSVTGPILGTRESRHVNATYQLTADDITTGARFDDTVARGAWAMEYHAEAGRPSEWISVKDQGAYDIPLGTLSSVDTPNLFAAGRAADGDQYAGGSLRVMGTAFATGHAAGVAAALHASTGQPADAAQVRVELQKQDARLP